MLLLHKSAWFECTYMQLQLDKRICRTQKEYWSNIIQVSYGGLWEKCIIWLAINSWNDETQMLHVYDMNILKK